MERRAKIVATLGPASSSGQVIERLLDAGLDVVRLNLSHGSHDDHRAMIREVRERARERERFIPIVLDLMGPRYRLGEIPGGERRLVEGETVRLGAEGAAGEGLPVGNPDLLRHLKPGERVLLDNGLLELEVESCEEGAVAARVVQGGRVGSRKGINLPDTELPFDISAKDRADIAFAVAEDVDYLAASYVHRAADLDALQEVVAAAGGQLPLIAKLERQGSIDRLEELVEGADAVMVARGDLGVEVPLHRVPVLQKEIIAAGRRRGKPVIVATEMLESMMEQPRPTRAEASDVANAVFDGADALMLSGETAAGRHPVAAVEVMDRIILEAEAYDRRQAEAGRRRDGFPAGQAEAAGEADALAIAEVVSAAAVYAAERLGVRRIVAFSQGGFTARMISRSRPAAPILVFTTDPAVARRIQLVWGVRPLLMDTEADHHDEVVQVVERQLLATGLAQPGESIVILMGDPIRERPLTNLLRVHRLRE
ncbi:MAG TPA: pyruvate kinase [Thermoanaerobaculia bacterium]|nr:pyruvate kinase [Thermoanaerobaculia bacterium]